MYMKAYLTLVRAVISFLYVFDLQDPVIWSFRMEDLEALVVGVSQHARW